MLVVVNEEGKYTQRIPSPSEREESDKRVLEVGILVEGVTMFAVIPPQQSIRFSPGQGVGLYMIRSRHATARYAVHVFSS